MYSGASAVEDGSRITGEVLQKFYGSWGLEPLAPEANSQSVSFQQLRRAIASQSLYQYEQGRYFVALSLEEGQHLRAAIHRLSLDQVAPVLPASCSLALRILPSSPRHSSCHLLASLGSHARHGYQLQAAEQCFHFTNCDSLPPQAQLVLLRVLRSAPLEKRRLWWEIGRAHV